MRAFALTGFAALAISLMAPASVWAWSTEQATSNGAATNLAEQEDPLKALEDKVNGKNPAGQSGFYVTGNGGQQPYSPFGYNSNSNSNAPFSPPGQPGLRGLPQ